MNETPSPVWNAQGDNKPDLNQATDIRGFRMKPEQIDAGTICAASDNDGTKCLAVADCEIISKQVGLHAHVCARHALEAVAESRQRGQVQASRTVEELRAKRRWRQGKPQAQPSRLIIRPGEG